MLTAREIRAGIIGTRDSIITVESRCRGVEATKAWVTGVRGAILPIIARGVIQVFHTTGSNHTGNFRTGNAVFASAVHGCVVTARVWMTGIRRAVDAVITCLVCRVVYTSSGVSAGIDGAGVVIITVQVQRRVDATENRVTNIRGATLTIVTGIALRNVVTGSISRRAGDADIDGTDVVVIAVDIVSLVGTAFQRITHIEGTGVSVIAGTGVRGEEAIPCGVQTGIGGTGDVIITVE